MEGRMHDHAKYGSTLDGVAHHVHDHKLGGRRIRELGGLSPPEDHVLILVLHRSSQSVGLDQEVHLHEKGAATLLSFRSDRLWNFTLDGHGFKWGASRISEADVRRHAHIPDDDEILIEGERRQVVPRGGEVDLAAPGVERLITRKAPPKAVEIHVNGRRREVPDVPLTFEALIALAFDRPPTGPGVSFTAVYRKGPHERPEGSLVAGQSVHVRSGEVFNVRHTDKS